MRRKVLVLLLLRVISHRSCQHLAFGRPCLYRSSRFLCRTSAMHALLVGLDGARPHSCAKCAAQWQLCSSFLRPHLRRRPMFLLHPLITICCTSSGNGRCSAFASSQGARIQTSRSSSVVRITGIALWIDATIAFGEVGRKADRAARTASSRMVVVQLSHQQELDVIRLFLHQVCRQTSTEHCRSFTLPVVNHPALAALAN